MNDMRPWPKRPTGQFLYGVECSCMHCKESLPWRLMIGLGIVLSALILALN